jgi:hypothetical protein
MLLWQTLNMGLTVIYKKAAITNFFLCNILHTPRKTTCLYSAFCDSYQYLELLMCCFS